MSRGMVDKCIEHALLLDSFDDVSMLISGFDEG